MDLSNLKPANGSTHRRKRVARGQASSGDTAGRGHKGQRSRSGFKRRIGFEGGQMPLYRRLPKFGFKNINRVEYCPINIDTLQEMAEAHSIDTFTPAVFVELGLAKKKDRIKILGRGEITTKIDVQAHAFSSSAVKAIEDKGGIANKITA